MRKALVCWIGARGCLVLAAVLGMLAVPETALAAPPFCGDGKCQGKEDATTCPADCGGGGGGEVGQTIPVCIELFDFYADASNIMVDNDVLSDSALDPQILRQQEKQDQSSCRRKPPDYARLGYPFNRTGCRLRRWITLVLARTIRGPWASSRPGSAPMRTVLDYLEWL